MGLGLEAGPQEALLPLPAAAAPSNRPPSQQCPFPSSCLCLSSQPSNRLGLSGRERGRMAVPRMTDGAPGAQDEASPRRAAQRPPSSRTPRPPGPPNPRVYPSVSEQIFRSLNPPGSPPPSLLAAGRIGFPGSLLATFCELKDWVQWYRTRLSLGQWAWLAASCASGASAGFAASLSSAEMGHQLQLVGVRLLGVAMTARNPREESGRLRRRRRLSLAQHHMASRACPSPSLARSLPSPRMSLLTGRGGEGRGDPGSSLPPPPLGPPLARLGKAVSPRSSSVQGREAP